VAEQDGQEKKHDPIEKTWREAAEKGQIPKSQDLSAMAVVLAGTAALAGAGSWIAWQMGQVMRDSFAFGARPHLDIAGAVAISRELLRRTAAVSLVPLVVAGVVAAIVHLAQTRGRTAPKALEPNWSRVNPLSGFKQQYMSWTPLVELAKGISKLGLLFLIGVWVVWARVSALPTMSTVAPKVLLHTMVDLATTFVFAAGPILLVVGLADYAYSYYRQFQQLKRTDQQLREDMKQMSGDPHMKAHRRAQARKYARVQLEGAVRAAQVVLTNPTHYAVVIRYDRGKDDAPVVAFKGVDHLAAQIRAAARRHNIPMIEDRPLARAIYGTVEVGRPIPEIFYGPVARVLAAVWERRAKRLARR